MPKGKKKKESQTVYRVLIGCNTSDETRYEIGDTFKESEVKTDDIEALLEMNAIEEVK